MCGRYKRNPADRRQSGAAHCCDKGRAKRVERSHQTPSEDNYFRVDHAHERRDPYPQVRRVVGKSGLRAGITSLGLVDQTLNGCPVSRPLGKRSSGRESLPRPMLGSPSLVPYREPSEGACRPRGSTHDLATGQDRPAYTRPNRDEERVTTSPSRATTRFGEKRGLGVIDQSARRV